MEILHTLFFFTVVIGVLVSIHEFGHFWVARKMGVKVLRFSVGFGKVLFSFRAKADSTEYVLSAIPLGGYVRMVDEREGEVRPEDLAFAFNRQSVLARSAIVAAGPLFNLILAVLLFWGVLVIGETGMKPILGSVDQRSIAAQAGINEGDEILSVNNKHTPTWSEALNVIMTAALEGEQEILLTVRDKDAQEHNKKLQFTQQDQESPQALYTRLGFKPWQPKLKPVIGQIMPESAALAAGLKSGDRLISADGEPLFDWQQWVEIVKKHPNKAIVLVIERDGVVSPLSITPQAVTVDQKLEGKIGASVHIPEALIQSMTAEYVLSPWAAIPEAFAITYRYSWATLKVMGKMIVGRASVENLSGPISIAQYAGQSASMGLTHFLRFMALVSVSLGVLNLLPVPVLDGGHLLFFLIEGIKGKPVPEKLQALFQQVGVAMLFSLMALAIFLDVQRLFQ